MQDLVDKKLAVVLFQNEYVKISLKGKISLVILQWQRQISVAERIAGYETVFEIIKRLQISNLLVDNEQIFLFTGEEKKWIGQNFSQWIQELKLKKFAIVTSDIYKNLTDLVLFVENMKLTYQSLGMVAHEFFTDYDTAMLWFKEKD